MNTRLLLSSSTALLFFVLASVTGQETPKPPSAAADLPAVPGLDVPPKKAQGAGDPTARERRQTTYVIPRLEPIPEGALVEPVEEQASVRNGREIIHQAKLKVLQRHYEKTLSETLQLEKDAASASPEKRAKMEAKAAALRAFLGKLETDIDALAKRDAATGKPSEGPPVSSVPGLDAPETGNAGLAGLAGSPGEFKKLQVPGLPAPIPGEIDGQRAARLARAVHERADAFAKLPRFDYQVQYRYGVVDTLRVVDATLETMWRALVEPVRDQDWIDYECGFSWDEQRLISELRPGKFDLPYQFVFGTAGDSWSRHEGKDRKDPNFFRGTGIGKVWNDPTDEISRSSIDLFQFGGYLRLTPHRFWWGPTARSESHTLFLAKLDEVVWRYLGTETVDGEVCDVVEAAYLKSGQRAQGLWISQKTGHARGVVSYFADSQPNELIRFDDFREVSPGVWIPFREVRTFAHASDATWKKRKLFRGETIVSQIRTDRDLTGRYAELLPKQGDRVQDMRFGPHVDLPYSAKRSDDEISQLAETKRKEEQLKQREKVQHIVKPLEDLVGKAAPTLPADGWLGGARPDLEGKPYLIYFWATWSRECKPDYGVLRALVGEGVNVVGIHPAGTPAAEIEKVIYGEKFRFPTLLTPDEKDDKKPKKLGAYPYTMLAYFVFVDSFGRVAAHGTYHDVYRAASDAAFVAKMGTKPTPALDASRWLNSSEPLTLDGLKGKTVLLDFWGQWSGPCVKQLPICEQLHTKFKDRGLVVIGVHSAHRPDKLDALLKEKKVTFPVMIDRGESADGFQVNVWPSYVLIDKTGKIAWGFSQEPPSAAVIEDFLSAKESVIP